MALLLVIIIIATHFLPYHYAFYHNSNVDNIFAMTSNGRLAPAHLCQVSWSHHYGSVSELREFNLKKKKMKNFDLCRAIFINPLSHACNNLCFWSVVMS